MGARRKLQVTLPRAIEILGAKDAEQARITALRILREEAGMPSALATRVGVSRAHAKAILLQLGIRAADERERARRRFRATA